QFTELSHKIRQAIGKKQAEQALQDSRKELADIIDFLPDSTFAIDINGRIIAWNRAIEKLTGIPSSEMMGKGEHAYAIRFYGDPRPVLIDLIKEPDETIEQFYPNMYRTGTSITAETMLPLPKRELIPVLINACPLYNQAGTITGAIESIRDLSGFRKIEEEKNWFGSILEKSVNEIYIFDAVSLKFINANQGARRNLGYTLDELHSLTPLDLKPELTLESFEALITPLRSGDTEEVVFFTVHQRKNKTLYPVEVHLQFSLSGDTPVFVAIILDITKRTKSEVALQESELRFRSLIQNSSDIIRILDKDGVIIFDSPSSSIILGYPEGFLIGSKGFDYIHPEDQLRVQSDFRDVCLEQNTHIPTEYRIRRADGTYLYVESIALNRIGFAGIDGIIVTIHPIQNQKMAEMEIRKMADDLSAAYEELASTEEELRQNYIELVKKERTLAMSEERFRNMAERSSDLILILDTTFRVTYASPSSLTIIGYTPEELREQSPELAVSTIFSPNTTKFKEIVQSAMDGEPIESIEIRITKKEGTAAYVAMSAVPVIRDGVLTGAQVSMRDVTRAKLNEIALIESETKYRTLFNDAILGIFRSTPEGQYLDMNPAFAHIAGYNSPAEMMQDINNIQTQLYVRPEDRQTIYKLLSTAGEIRGFETEILHRSGDTIWISINAKGIRDADGDILWYEGTIEDISSRRKAEIEVAHKNDELQASLEELSGAEEELKEQLNEIYAAHIEIKERELKYQQLFEASEAGIALHEIVYDENRIPIDYLFLDVNPAFEKITGVDANNLIGKTILEVFPATEPYWIENYGRVVLTGKTTHLENFHHDIGKYFEVTVYSIQNSKIVALIQDASERKRYEIHLRETNAYLDNLISNANVPIIVWDPSLMITRLNHSCELLIGRLEQDVVKKPISMLFPPEQIEASMRLIRTTLEGVRWDTLKIDIQHLDGSRKSVIWNSSTIYGPDGSTPVATIAQGRDVTNELLLESEKGAAALQIQENIAKLAILNDGIRNPLTIILLYADQTGNPEIIENIQSQIKHIDEMVSNLDSEWVRSVKILEYLRKHGDFVNEFYPVPSTHTFDPCKSFQQNNSRKNLPIHKEGIFIEEIQAQLYIILDSIDALIYVTDIETHDLLYLNNVGRRMYGDVIGKKCFKAIHNGLDKPCSFCQNHHLMNKSVPTGVHIWEYYDGDLKRWFENRDRAICWTNGRIAILKIATDITDRKLNERALLESEENAWALINAPDESILLVQS
ncbi:MAG: PAS domain S-box protein, partial [Methanospirillum sp.]|uniref:PAS domain S-box protein n=1 Tax=Methanospirillum sp. TaxID=45200 RepID=UPI00236DD7C2